jgi:Arc/MetJ family transcription regulator
VTGGREAPHIFATITDGTVERDGVTHTWSTIGLYRASGGRITECTLVPYDATEFDVAWSWPWRAEVYHWCIARTNIDIDEDAVHVVMERYRLRTKREAVNFALRSIAGEPLDLNRARGLRGSGWEGDLGAMRGARVR